MTDMIGKRLGQYELLAPLGQGGMASVYRARQLNVKREVAIKVIKANLAQTPDFILRFEREAQTIASLSHPHILKLFDFGEHEGTIYLVTELLSGGNLSDLIRKRSLALERVEQILDQIASALNYAHQRDIVHRDLKPQNVLLDDTGNAFLADFGIAKMMSDSTGLTQDGAAMGTPAYMSPEQWRGEEAGVQSDVYALGIILFEMLANRLPFTGDTPFSMMQMHIYETPTSIHLLRNGLPPNIDNIVAKALAKDAHKRFDSALALSAAFKAAVHGQELPKELTGPLEGPMRVLSDQSRVPGITPVSPAELESPTITPAQAVDQERRAILEIEADLRSRSIQAQSLPAVVRTTFINALPQDIVERFKDRVKAQADIVNLFLEKTRLVSILGRGGIGKTALACKVLADLQSAQSSNTPNGMIYLSLTSTGISVDRIFNDFSKMFQGEAKATIEASQRDPKLSIAQKTAALLSVLGKGYYILLLDNLETLQDAESGQLTDSDLQGFIEAVLGQGSNLRMLLTSREPLGLPRVLKTWERLVVLDEGLPMGDAIELLRTFDPDGIAGLRDAPIEKLSQVVEKTGGFPRALEAVAGLLLEDPLISLDELLEDMALFSGEITPIIVQQAISRLSPDAVRVMEALALFRRPVSQVALNYLLAPYLNTTSLRTILGRLVRGYFASYNKATQEFAIHSIDQQYCYSLIPEGGPDDGLAATPPYTRHALHHRAAEYYKLQRKPEAEWKSFDDVQPHLAEFDHRIGAGDANTAASVLEEITLDHLFVWGFYRLAAMNFEKVQDAINDDSLKQRSVHLLGIAYSHLGQIRQGIQCFERSLALSRLISNRGGEGRALNSLGLCHSDLAQTAKAVEYFEQALVIARETKNLRGEALTLNNLGLCYSNLGQLDEAAEYFEQALAVAKAADNRYTQTLAVCNLGRTLIDQDCAADAILRLQEGIDIAKELNSPELSNYSNGLMGLAHLYLNDLPAARTSAEAAEKFDDPQNNHTILALLGTVALRQTDRAAAQKAFSTVTGMNEGLENNEDYTVLEGKALAWSGLALCENSTDLSAALKAAQAARAGNSDPGVVQRALHLFDALAKADSAGTLAPVRMVLSGTQT